MSTPTESPSAADSDPILAMPIEAPIPPASQTATTGVEFSPIVAHGPAELGYETPTKTKWRVGTLSYTTGGLVVLFCLLLGGDFAYSMRERSVGPVVQLMLKRLHASDTLMAALFTTLPTALSLVISPVVSYRSDRHRGRWGRRIPFLLAPTPVAALAMFGMAYTEELGRALYGLLGGSVATQDGCALIVFGLLWTLFEVASIVAGSVLGGLINDVVPREVLGRFHGMFRQVSLGAGMIFNFLIVGYAETHYQWIFLGMGLLFLVGFSLMCLTVREGEYPPPAHTGADDNASGVARLLAASKMYLRECFRLPYYRRVFIGMALAGAAFLPVNTFSLLYAKQIGVPLSQFGFYQGVSYAVSFATAPLIGWLVDRAHALRVTMATLTLYSVLMVMAGFGVHDVHTFAVALIAHTVLSGLYWTASSPLGQMLFPRLTFTQYASAGAITSALFTMVFGPLLGRLLDMTHHDYRLTFPIGGVIGLIAMGIYLVVYRDFVRLGGPKHYHPPEVTA